MKIKLVQSALEWENPEANRNHLYNLIQSSAAADLIVLPEMFTTGFTMNPEAFAETPDGKTTTWLQNIAAETNSAITGSIIIKENGQFYNRLLFVYPSGEVKSYNKRHLFSLAGENKVYSAGKEKLIVEYLGWRICPLICYDLRFPVFSRNVEDYDLLLYVANWPSTRANAWNVLIKARAIENMAYVAGVNRIESDENGHQYNGDSQIIDPLGNEVISPNSAQGAVIATIDKAFLRETRNKLKFLEDRDRFTVE